MLDMGQIRAMAQKAARQAARARKCPLIVEKEDLPRLYEHMRHTPNFGDYRPKGWRLVQTIFVDTSGWGSEGEPAWTQRRLLEHITKRVEAGAGVGYALIEVGEFQAYVGEFVPEKREHGKPVSSTASPAR